MIKSRISKMMLSIIIVVCMVFNVFVPSMGVLAENKNSTASSMSFPSPVFKDKPVYFYETTKPSASIDASFGENYTPTLVENANSTAPVISSITAMAGPNDSVTIQGEGFMGGTVWVYGLDKNGEGMFTTAELTHITDTTVNAIINEKYRYSMYMVWVESASGALSRPALVNKAESDWISVDKASQGASVYFYGKNLTTDNSDADDAVSYIYLTNGTKSYKAEVTEANPYRVQFTVPEGIANGTYKVWAHNGHGGEYGWTEGLTLTVQKGAQNYWTGTTRTVYNVSQLSSAVSSAAAFDTIYLKNGTYKIDSTIYVKKALRFVGESKEGVKIISSPSNYSASHPCAFQIICFPSEFRNLSFEDDVNDFATYGIDKVMSEYIYAWGYQAKVLGNSTEYMMVENCDFKVNRLNRLSVATYNEEQEATLAANDAMLKEKYEYYSATTSRKVPLYIDQIDNVYVKGCHFEANTGASIYGGGKVHYTDNTSAGTCVNYGNSGSAVAYFFSCNSVDMSNNKVHGKDYHTDPTDDYEKFDLGFGRGVVFQFPSNSMDNTYIADNEFRAVGEEDGGSGEIILLESSEKIFYGGIKSISADGKTLTFNENIWTKADNGSYYHTMLGTTRKFYAPSSRLTVLNGKGLAQYRKIVSVTENSVTLDEPWDIKPATLSEDDSSYVMISYTEDNVRIFRNDVVGPKDWDTNFNSTAGVQAYAGILDYIGDRNSFSRVHTGFYCDTAFQYDYAKTDVGYRYFVDTILLNNKIRNVRDGIDVNLGGANEYGAMKFDGEELAHTAINLVVRNNLIDDAHFAYDAHNGGNGMEKIGGASVAIGTKYKSFSYYAPNGVCIGNWVKGTVVENNTLLHPTGAYIDARNHQGETIVRNNYCDGKGDIEDIIRYPEVFDSRFSATERAIVINNYGNETEGIYGTASNLESFDKLQNGNFAEDLKYWASNSGKGYAADNATVVNGAVKVSSRVGITSVDFKPQNIPANSKVAVVYDHKGSDKVRVELNGYGLQTVSRDKLNTFTNSDVANGWSRTINNYTLTTTEDLDLNVVIYSLDGTSAEIDNIEFVIINENQGYYETADGRRYNLLDGSAYGGTAQNGIVSNNADDIYKYGYTEGLANASFSEGLKFWQKSGTATNTISANGGKLVFSSAARYNGVISAPFKVVNSNYTDTNNRLAVMLDYTAITTTGSYYSVNLYETVNGTTTKYPLTITAGVTTANTNGFSGASGTASWKENAIYNLEIVANRNTFKSEINEVRLARYDGSALTYTDMLSGEIYKNNTTAKKLESVANISNNTVAEELKNGDFSDGNAYWYGTSTVTDGKLTPSANVTSLAFRVKAKKGDRLAVMFDYVATANATVTFAGSTTASKTVTKGSGSNVTSTTEFSSAYAYKITLSAGATYDNIRVVVVNADGTYTDTITGEIYGSDYKVLGGTYKDGYYSVGSDLGITQSAPQNLDFAEGLKYWTSKRDRNGYASDYATINEDGTVSIKSTKNFDGITSMSFKLPACAIGKNIVVSYQATGHSVNLRVFKNGYAAISTQSAASSEYESQYIDFWRTRSVTVNVASASDVFNLDFQMNMSNYEAGASYTGHIRNISIRYLDEGGKGLYTNFDGTPIDYQYGDANADGRVDLADLVCMKKYLADNSNKIYLAAANVDKGANGTVTANDISYVYNFVMTGKKEF